MNENMQCKMSAPASAPAAPLGDTVIMLSDIVRENKEIAMLIKTFSFGDAECKCGPGNLEGGARCMAEEIMLALEVSRATNKILVEIAGRLGAKE